MYDHSTKPRAVLPCLRPDLAMRADPCGHPYPVPAGFTPIVTLTMEDNESFYSIPTTETRSFVERGYVTCDGDMNDTMLCMIDMESCMRAHALVARGRVKHCHTTTVERNIRNEQATTSRLLYLIGRLLHAHARGYGHFNGVVGYRIKTPGIELGKNCVVSHERWHYQRYCAGHGDD